MTVLSQALSDNKISANPIAGYFHDHLFVPVEQAEEAVRILGVVRREARGIRMDQLSLGIR